VTGLAAPAQMRVTLAEVADPGLSCRRWLAIMTNGGHLCKPPASKNTLSSGSRLPVRPSATAICATRPYHRWSQASPAG
jgi:hypothetical protein